MRLRKLRMPTSDSVLGREYRIGHVHYVSQQHESRYHPDYGDGGDRRCDDHGRDRFLHASADRHRQRIEYGKYGRDEIRVRDDAYDGAHSRARALQARKEHTRESGGGLERSRQRGGGSSRAGRARADACANHASQLEQQRQRAHSPNWLYQQSRVLARQEQQDLRATQAAAYEAGFSTSGGRQLHAKPKTTHKQRLWARVRAQVSLAGRQHAPGFDMRFDIFARLADIGDGAIAGAVDRDGNVVAEKGVVGRAGFERALQMVGVSVWEDEMQMLMQDIAVKATAAGSGDKGPELLDYVKFCMRADDMEALASGKGGIVARVLVLGKSSHLLDFFRAAAAEEEEEEEEASSDEDTRGRMRRTMIAGCERHSRPHGALKAQRFFGVCQEMKLGLGLPPKPSADSDRQEGEAKEEEKAEQRQLIEERFSVSADSTDERDRTSRRRRDKAHAPSTGKIDFASFYFYLKRRADLLRK